MEKKHILVSGITSGIGFGLAKYFGNKGDEIFGTYRRSNEKLGELKCRTAVVDFLEPNTMDSFASEVRETGFMWDVLIICPGTMAPVGNFSEVPFDSWEENVRVNLLGTMRFIHLCLTSARPDRNCTVLLFAGGGTNGVTSNTSAYTISKIALIKAVELLQHECPSIKWSIVGPGWVDTEIHQETLNSEFEAKSNKEQTKARILSGDFTQQEKINKCCEWIINQEKSVVGGRNFSVVHDMWEDPAFVQRLLNEPDMFKLRRFGNH